MKSKAKSFFSPPADVDPLPPMSSRSATGSGSGFFASSCSFGFLPVLLFPFFESRVLGCEISSSNSELLDSDSTGLFFLVLMSMCFLVDGFLVDSVGLLLLVGVEPFPHGPEVDP